MAEPIVVDTSRAIREERRGACHVVTIDRGGALNAIDATMVTTLATSYPRLARDAGLYAVVLKSADPRAFSAGGDVRALLSAARRDPAEARAWLRAEYALNWLTECFSKPTVALIDGMVMGSGVGISAYLTHRVAGQRYSFAMPETAIGFFPDVGTAHLLARLPSRIGYYLGMTGARIGRADAYALGLVTHAIDAEHYPSIESGLADSQPIDPLLDDLHCDPGPSPLQMRARVIAQCFAPSETSDIMRALDDAAARTAGSTFEAEDRAFAAATRDMLAKRSPLALAATHRHIRLAAALDLRQTLEADYRLACRMVECQDFAEGIRAALIDKDQAPRWQPAELADVTRDMLDDLFAHAPGEELALPLRQQMQAMRI